MLREMPSTPNEARDAAAALAQSIQRMSAALQPRRAMDMRSALDEVERRHEWSRFQAENAAAAARIALLEGELAALLAPSAAQTSAFYDTEENRLAQEIRRANQRRRTLDTQVMSTDATEMDRSRAAALSAAAHADEEELSSLANALRARRVLAEQLSARRDIVACLPRTLDETSHASLGLPASLPRYEGKVRDNYSLAKGLRLIVTTDRISAFDRVLCSLSLKGQILNGLSNWWFGKTRDVAPNHLLAVLDPQVVLAKECTPLPVEMVVRAYVTGVTSTSIWTAYERGERVFCGQRLPEGLSKNDALPHPILTPSTKAEHGGHDRSASREEILAEGRIRPEHFDKAAEYALALFARGQELSARQGLILVDTKYEFGLDEEGEVVVIDEIHTPDSSRYWRASSYDARRAQNEEPESFDKEFVRRWLAATGFKGDGDIPHIPDDIRVEASLRYLTAFEAITGAAFRPDLGDPVERIRENLARGRDGASLPLW